MGENIENFGRFACLLVSTSVVFFDFVRIPLQGNLLKNVSNDLKSLIVFFSI